MEPIQQPNLFQGSRESLPASVVRPRSFYNSSESLIARYSQTPLAESSETAVDQWVQNAGSSLGNFRNIGLILGGGLLLRAASRFMSAQQLRWTYQVTEQTQEIRWMRSASLISAFSLATLAGCASENPSYDGGNPWRPDTGGTGGSDTSFPDLDRDGYPSNVDCDDTNADVLPLPSTPQVVTFTSSKTICPGIYHGITLYISPSSNVELRGDQVQLNGDTADTRPAFVLSHANDSLVTGFSIYNYNPSLAVVHVDAGNRNTFQEMNIEVAQGRRGFQLKHALDVTIQNCTFNTHSDVVIYGENVSHRLTVRNSIFQGVPPFDGVPAYGFITMDDGDGHRIESNAFRDGSGFGLELYNTQNSQILNNEIVRNMRHGIEMLNSRNNLIQGNTIRLNTGYGIYLRTQSTPNTFTNNILTDNGSGPLFADSTCNTGNTFTGNTPNP